MVWVRGGRMRGGGCLFFWSGGFLLLSEVDPK